MSRTKTLLKLMLDFMTFGCCTFGGGMSIIAQMQQKYVEKEKSITVEELLDLTSVARSLPGIMIGNVAMLYGYRVAGLPGGLICTFSMTLPPMAILLCICFFYRAFRSNSWVAAVMGGTQAAVAPIIASAAIGMAKGSIPIAPCAVVAAVCLLLYLFTGVNTIILVLVGAVSGLVLGEYLERKGAGKHGAA